MGRRPQRPRLLDAVGRISLPRSASPSFAEAMRRQGAVPLPPAPARVLPAPRTATVTRAPAAPTFEVDEREGFIDGARRGLPAAQLRKLRGTPNATLDLHGHHLSTAQRAVADFIERERRVGHERVLIIVGKGRHTAGGVGVLRSEIAGWLSAPPIGRHVLAFTSAPPELGGSGCVLVLLARSRPAR